MTRNQIEYLKLLETKRSNQAQEALTASQQAEVMRANRASEAELNRSNLAREGENLRHNKVSEGLSARSL